MVASAPESYLRGKKESAVAPERAELWSDIEDLYVRKQWHPLVQKLKELLADGRFVAEEGERLVDLYDTFISDFQSRLNPLELALIARPIAMAVKHDRPRAHAFLDSVCSTVKGESRAKAFVTVCMAEVDLHAADAVTGACAAMPDVKKRLDEAGSLLDDTAGVSASVHGYYYRVSADYHKQLGDHAAYYADALRHLGCTPMGDIGQAELKLTAVCLAGAALLGKDIYNFGELLAHPIMDVLRAADCEPWLAELLVAFNKGDMATFDRLRPKWALWDDLTKDEPRLLEKIRLLALMEMAYARGAHERRIGLDEIAQRTGVPADEVELLVMKAQSRRLIRGRIDAVHRLLTVEWVMPRVLDKEQARTVADCMAQWSRNVQRMRRIVTAQQQQHEALMMVDGAAGAMVA